MDDRGRIIDFVGGLLVMLFLWLFAMTCGIVGCQSTFKAEAIRNQAATFVCDIETGLCEFTWNEVADD